MLDQLFANFRADFIKLTILISISLVATVVTSSESQRSGYGEECSDTLRCDRKSWLRCFSGICGCIKPDRMIYEPEAGKCASTSGQRCKYIIDTDHSKSEGNLTYVITDCVENAACSEEGYCVCAEDYYGTANGTCSLKGKYYEPCDDVATCLPNSGIICQNGRCECDGDVSIDSEVEGQCLGLVGYPCISNKCTVDAYCNNHTCVCNEGFYHNSENRCSTKKNYLERCSQDDHCKHEGGFLFKCLEGVCDCDPNLSIYGKAKKHKKDASSYCSYPSFNDFDILSKTQCLGKAGSPCIEGLCAPGSFCRYTNNCDVDNLDGTCSCEPNYTLSTSGICKKIYGESCETPNICIDGTFCNVSANKCECRYPKQKYNEMAEKCVSPVGHPCDATTLCGIGAECQKINYSPQGVCECKPGYVEDAFGSCNASFGTPCSADVACDKLAGLYCIEFTCECRDFQQFSLELEKCVGLIGSDCIPDDKDQCVENAECQKIRDGLNTGRCRCVDNFRISVNYTCEATGMHQTR